MREIEFWFDFSSPYAYFAALQIEELAERHGRTVRWRPFFIGAAFRVTGMRPLTIVPLRGDYARRDWDRLARKLSAPFTMPVGFPMVGAKAGRAFYWLQDQHYGIAVCFAKAMLHNYFGEGLADIEEEAVLRIAAECGADVRDLKSALASEVLNLRFRKITSEAVARGVFGSPFFFVDSEPFWGSDRLALMDEWLSRGGW